MKRVVWREWREHALREIDPAPLALFRVLVGLLLGWEAWSWTSPDLVTAVFDNAQTRFHYTFFPWIPAPQGLVPYVYGWVLLAFSLAVVLGWRTRWTGWILALCWWYWFLIDAANYTDHTYLLGVASLLAAWLPTNRAASVDRVLQREQRTTIPGWALAVVRGQLILVQLFFSLALLNSDWLRGAPLLEWLVVPEFDPQNLRNWSESQVVLLAWTIPCTLLLGTLGLCWERTRIIAVVWLIVWHVVESQTLGIGISPWFQALWLLIFLPAHWIRAAVTAIHRGLFIIPGVRGLWQMLCRVGMLLDACVAWFDDTPLLGSESAPQAANSAAANNATIRRKPPQPVSETSSRKGLPETPRITFVNQVVLVLWGLSQVILPVRYVVLPGPTDWSDLATTFAWRGLNRLKRTTLRVNVVQPSQELSWPLEPTDEFPVPLAMLFSEAEMDELRLTEGSLRDLVAGPAETLQQRIEGFGIKLELANRILRGYETTTRVRLTEQQYQAVSQRPELLRQYGLQVAQVLGRMVNEELYVHANLQVAYNDRPLQLLFSPEVDLAEQNSFQSLALQVQSLKTPLPSGPDRIAAAQAWYRQRMLDEDLDFEVMTGKNVRPGEPYKLPPITDEDERWFQEQLRK